MLEIYKKRALMVSQFTLSLPKGTIAIIQSKYLNEGDTPFIDFKAYSGTVRKKQNGKAGRVEAN